MDYTEMIFRAIEYIEHNLKNEIHLDDIADAAYCSSFHFHRLFKQVVGDTPGNYIRKRRLTEAARELKDSDRRILDIAIEYGFESQSSFTYAFKNQHFVSPGLFRRGNRSSLYFLKRFTRQNLMNYRRVRMTEPKIIKKEAIKFVGAVCMANTKDLSGIDDIYVNLKKNVLAAGNRKDLEHVYGICFHDPDYTVKTGRFNYMVAVETESLDNIPLEMVGKTLPAHEYAVFRSKDTTYEDIDAVVSEMWNYSRDWIAGNKIKQNRYFDFECYTEDEKGNLKYLEIYIPIIR